MNVRAESGSALFEFVVFVLLGQLLVFAGSMAIASEFSSKVELQIMASQAARNLALERLPSIPSEVELVRDSCSVRLICVTLKRGKQVVSAVSFQ